MDSRVTKKNVETLKEIIKKFGYEQEMREFSRNFEYRVWQKLCNKVNIELQEENYQKTGVYKMAYDIYGKKEILTERQMKALERQMQIDYLNIKVPLNDFSFLSRLIK